MSEEDWVILRVIMVAAKHAPHNPDVVRAIVYLMDKHGSPTVLDCINQLNRGGEQ